MSKFLTRIAAILLIPCLMLDPATSAVLSSPLSMRVILGTTEVNANIFAAQALVQLNPMRPSTPPKALMQLCALKRHPS